MSYEDNRFNEDSYVKAVWDAVGLLHEAYENKDYWSFALVFHRSNGVYFANLGDIAGKSHVARVSISGDRDNQHFHIEIADVRNGNVVVFNPNSLVSDLRIPTITHVAVDGVYIEVRRLERDNPVSGDLNKVVATVSGLYNLDFMTSGGWRCFCFYQTSTFRFVRKNENAFYYIDSQNAVDFVDLRKIS